MGGARTGELAISRLRRHFEELVDRHYEGVWRYARFLTRGATEAEDLVHEAFLLAFDRLMEGQEFAGDAGAWLRGTLRNLVKAWWRERQKLPQDVADHLGLLADKTEEAWASLAGEELRAALDHCLGLLGPEDRDLVARRYERGMRITRIAEELRRNAATVRVQLFRIRQALKECVEGQLAKGLTT
ncbi:MAG: sigma-70 family RNA polymerase sigma factor [Planctomycetes bacterium]|nr:sigma-70 family RNA polymerase sigma factor [Planctomycetota bacterium]